MAITKLTSQWKGVSRDYSGVVIENCYDVYADMAGGSSAPFLRLNGLCIYSLVKSSVSDLLPITISVQVGDGATYTFVTGSSVTNGGYSPNGNWMEYYVKFVAPDSAASNIFIPNNGQSFQIHVTLTPSTGNAISFTENACGIQPMTMTTPYLKETDVLQTEMTTGRVYYATLSSQIPVDSSHRVSGSFVWYPKYLDYVTTEHIEDLFVDPYTKITDAEAAYNKFYFAVANTDHLPNTSGARQNATLSFHYYYLSSDFYNGIMISSVYAQIPVAPRDVSLVDDDLMPDGDGSTAVITAIPEGTQAGNKFVAGYASLVIRPNTKLRYQSGSSSYYRFSVLVTHDGRTQTYFSSGDSVTVPTYQQYLYNAETGTYTAMDSFTASYECTVWDRWSRCRTYGYHYYINVPMVGYSSPQIQEFSVHRCKPDEHGTYTYGGETYAKDDYGAYCLIEYTVNFNALENTNVGNMLIRYGTTDQAITISSYTQSGYIVVPANTETTLDVLIKLWDNLTPGGVIATLRLSTAGVLIDWLAGGKGMAIGKVAEDREVLDINPDWKLLFYQATIGNYKNNTAQDLIAWMHDIDDRLDALENSSTAN